MKMKQKCRHTLFVYPTTWLCMVIAILYAVLSAQAVALASVIDLFNHGKPRSYCNTSPLLLAKSNSAHAKNFAGNISWYGPRFQGRRTASGEIFDMYKLTAAHRTLPMFTRVLVENPKNGQSIVVKINDRGPYVKHRIMDITREGARRLNTLSSGTFYGQCLVID